VGEGVGKRSFVALASDVRIVNRQRRAIKGHVRVSLGQNVAEGRMVREWERERDCKGIGSRRGNDGRRKEWDKSSSPTHITTPCGGRMQANNKASHTQE